MIQLGRVGTEIPVPHTEIERLVQAASEEIDVKGDRRGFYNQTIENIAAATFMQKGGDFWLIWENQKGSEPSRALGYALGCINKDVDNQLTYFGTQAYADPSIRHTQVVKDLWNKVEGFAKQQFCKHFIIVSSRKAEAYRKFLGSEWQDYAVLLKKDI